MTNINENQEKTKNIKEDVDENETNPEFKKISPLSSKINQTCINITNVGKDKSNQIPLIRAEPVVKYINSPDSSTRYVPISPKPRRHINLAIQSTPFTVKNKTELIPEEVNTPTNISNNFDNESDNFFPYEGIPNHSDLILEGINKNKTIERSESNKKPQIDKSYTKKLKNFEKDNENSKILNSPQLNVEKLTIDVANPIIHYTSLSNRRQSMQQKSPSQPNQIKNNLPIIKQRSPKFKMFNPKQFKSKTEQTDLVLPLAQEIFLKSDRSQTMGSIQHSNKNPNSPPNQKTEDFSFRKKEISLIVVSETEETAGIKSNFENLNIGKSISDFPPQTSPRKPKINVKLSNIVEKR